LLALAAGWVGGIDRIDRQALPAHGILEGTVQGGVHTSYGGGGEGALAVQATTGQDFGIEGIDRLSAHPIELQ
jgi:hypothetical protein